MSDEQEFINWLNNEVNSIIGSPISIFELRKKYNYIIKEKKKLFSKKPQTKSPSPDKIWRNNPRPVKFLTEEIFPSLVFFEQYDIATKLRFYNDSRNYDVELLDENHQIIGYIEISFAKDGKYENEIDKTVNSHGIWVGNYSDQNPANNIRAEGYSDQNRANNIRCRLIKVMQKKSKKPYPKNTSLIIFSGTMFPISDDFDDDKPDASVESYLDQTVELMKDIPNEFENIWFVDRHPPHKIRTIK